MSTDPVAATGSGSCSTATPVNAMKAPSMNSAPCAKLMRLETPNTSEKPSAIRA